MPATEPPEAPDLVDEWDAALDPRSSRDRVYETAIQLTVPTSVRSVAERAECAKETARRHLDWLVEIGILTQVTTDPAAYTRNEAYFAWKRVHDLRTRHSDEELRAQLTGLTSELEAYQERYGAAHPEDVDALDHVDDVGDVEEVWMELSEWESIRRRIRELDRARRSRREGVHA